LNVGTHPEYLLPTHEAWWARARHRRTERNGIEKKTPPGPLRAAWEKEKRTAIPAAKENKKMRVVPSRYSAWPNRGNHTKKSICRGGAHTHGQWMTRAGMRNEVQIQILDMPLCGQGRIIRARKFRDYGSSMPDENIAPRPATHPLVI